METARETAHREAALRDYAKYGLFQSLPDSRVGFAEDLSNNYRHIAENFKNGTMLDALIMSENYALQMILEYKKQAGFLPESTVYDIINQVGDALKMILPSVTTSKFLEDLDKRVRTKLERSDIEKYIEDYWNNYDYIDRHR
jgi:hypothetical protein